MSKPQIIDIATLAAGCFWCIEAAYDTIKGIEKIQPGYTGGFTENPSYEKVCTGTTGHAEAVQIFFNTKQITYKEILEVFFTIHDPTSLNRQGADIGTQYRSAIFYHNEKQREIAINLIEKLNKKAIFTKPIVTIIEPFQVFYNAEAYHTDYYKKHQKEPYCQVVITPKIAKLRQKFKEKIKFSL